MFTKFVVSLLSRGNAKGEIESLPQSESSPQTRALTLNAMLPPIWYVHNRSVLWIVYM
jgi:hypothetical protein